MICYKVVYAQEAYRDLVNIYNYILSISLEPSVASNLVSKIKNAIESLSTLPFRHPIFDIVPKKGIELRKLLVKNYIVLYCVDVNNKAVNIVRMFSGKRDYKNIPI